MSGICECHGHILMRGDLSGNLDMLKNCGVTYFREGGDAEGRSAVVKRFLQEHQEYGLEYVTPVFALHKNGRYGGIVGKAFENSRDFLSLVREAASFGSDFVKIMFSGIVTFEKYGELSCEPLSAAEIKELVSIAHGEGFAVMAHTNGRDAFMAAVEAGTDSIEHGVFIDEECLHALAESESIWVPTIAAIAAFAGRSGSGEEARWDVRQGFDADITRRTVESHMAAVRRGHELGAKIAAGADSGAFAVPPGSGTLMEYDLLRECGLSDESITDANEMIRARFKRQR